MPWRELIMVRVSELEPGQRIRLPRMSSRAVQTVVSVHESDEGAFILGTDVGAYVCDPADMIDAEVNSEVW